MRTRKEMKKAAKHVMKKHYFLLIILCLFSAVLGEEFTNSTSALTGYSTENTVETGDDVIVTTAGNSVERQGGAMEAITEMLDGNTDDAKKIADGIKEDAVTSTKEGKVNPVFGRSRGVLAGVVNFVASGSFAITLISALYSIGASGTIISALMIFGSALFSFAIWYFMKNVLVVIVRRMFLEARVYDKVPVNRLMFLLRVKKWMKVSWVMFVRFVYLYLWMLTIVGGIIKMYSYWMVPYIVAENPDMKANEAITLSRKMMDGHKWECFVMVLSYLGWTVLGIFTLGLSALFYSNAYREVGFCEYYAELRKLAKENNIAGAEALNDECLFTKPSEESVKKAYADVLELISQPEEESYKLTGIRGFIANVFGVVLFNSKEEKKYEENQMRIIRYRMIKEQVELEAYPSRMLPIPEHKKLKRVSSTYYMRHYTVWSLILLFFIFSVIGWIWEVSLHLVSDGVFVNRGTMHGPWLPIYGTGGVLILIVLNKFRKNPLVEFITAIILCGCVEYFTSYYLELTHDGKKWWDYSGYFLNINGRICAEGLLVFGLGGMGIVYFLAPLLDNHLKGIPYKVVIPLCIALLSVYMVDKVYSGKHPNEGKGITDYAGASIEENSPGMLNISDIQDLPKIHYQI